MKPGGFRIREEATAQVALAVYVPSAACGAQPPEAGAGMWLTAPLRARGLVPRAALAVRVLLGFGRAWEKPVTVRGGLEAKPCGVWMAGPRRALPARIQMFESAPVVTTFLRLWPVGSSGVVPE